MEYKNRRINEDTNPDRILLNQKMVNEYRGLRENQKSSRKAYCRGKSVTKTKLGKLVRLCLETSETGAENTPENKAFRNLEEQKNAVEQNQRSINKERLLHLLEEYPLTGMSGNGFGVKDKLEALPENPRVLLVNGVECEPGLLHDEWLLQNFEEEISQGMDFLCQCIPFERRIIACKVLREDRKAYGKKQKVKREHGRERKDKRECNDGYKGGYKSGYEVCNVPAVYPMGEEHLLIRQVLGEELNREEKPSDAGILVMNVQTVYQIYCLITGQYQGGRCNRKCPAGVDIREIVKIREKNPKADISNYGIENCIHCKSCTFFCRAGKNIQEYLMV